MNSIAIFNNKGGVGKTTFLCNLAAYLEIFENKKVIIIDADPQSNATQYMLPFDDTIELYKGSSANTLNKVFGHYRKHGIYYSGELPIIRSPRFEVDLIPGDPSISLFEDFLSKDWFEGTIGEARGLRTTLIFKNLLDQLEKLDYDIALFDVGPSLGAINRSILLSSDYMVLPMSSDIFSLKAIENIKKSLDQWRHEFEDGIKKYTAKIGEPLVISPNEESVKFELRFLGYITQQYTAKSVRGKKQAVRAFEKIIKKIPDTVVENLAVLNGEGINIDYLLGEIPTLHSLIPMSQSANCPIFSLKAEDGVVGAHFSKVNEYKDIIEGISERLLENMNILDND